MSRPRLLILTFSNLASDARVLKQVRHFVKDYEVTTCAYGPPPHPEVTHYQIPEDADFRRWTRAQILSRRYAEIYWNLSAVKQSQELLRGQDQFDVIIANDIDTVGLALALAPRLGVHADIHEFAPRQNEEMLLWRLLVAPYVRWMCKEFLPLVSSMTTVGEGLAAEYKKDFGLDADVVTNAAPLSDLAPSPVSEPIRLVHSGAALRNRRLEILLDAVAETHTDVTLDLYLMANDPEYIQELRERAGERVRVLDPVPYSELIPRLNEYDVGVHVIPPTNFNNRWSLPNKFFDYVQARLALVIGPSPEMTSRLTEHGLGAVAEAFTAKALKKVLDQLSAAQVAEWKQNSHASADPLSAESQVMVWDRAIRNLARE